jgi:hypothetical protein
VLLPGGRSGLPLPWHVPREEPPGGGEHLGATRGGQAANEHAGTRLLNLLQGENGQLPCSVSHHDDKGYEKSKGSAARREWPITMFNTSSQRHTLRGKQVRVQKELCESRLLHEYPCFFFEAPGRCRSQRRRPCKRCPSFPEVDRVPDCSCIEQLAHKEVVK